MSSRISTSGSPSYSFSKCIISCHCGESRQTVELQVHHNGNGPGGHNDRAGPDPEDKSGTQQHPGPNLEITLCHCYTCRHTTGQMFASWLPIRAPGAPDAEDKNLQTYRVVQRYVAQSSEQQHEDPGSEGTEQEGGEQEGREHEARTDYYFCGTCGCHLFRRVCTGSEAEGRLTDESERDMERKKECKWEVATGVIVEDSLMSTGSGSEDAQQSGPHMHLAGIKWRHEKVGETKDGGISVWLDHGKNSSAIDTPREVETKAVGTETDSREASSWEHKDHQEEEEAHLRQQEEAKSGTGTTLRATCHCENVSFSIIRPSTNPASSTGPRSNVPDLMYPYVSTPKSVISNPDDVKWWLRVPSTLRVLEEKKKNEQEGNSKVKIPKGTKYLAGTCACRSCRLTSGFEIQSWAFIPRGNIFMDLPLPLEGKSPGSLPSSQEQGGGGRGRRTVPLEFPSSHGQQKEQELGGDSYNEEGEDKRGMWPLKSYESSPGVVREFCPVCGATVFWHDKWRPDLIDVSVGLLRFPGDVDMGLGSGLGETGSYHDASGWSGGAGVEADADGARHESWLEWWRERVSFAQDAGLDRIGGCSVWGRELVGELERGLRSKGGEESLKEE